LHGASTTACYFLLQKEACKNRYYLYRASPDMSVQRRRVCSSITTFVGFSIMIVKVLAQYVISPRQYRIGGFAKTSKKY